MKQTALHAAHQKHGARMVPFAGWEMPVQYSSMMTEAAHVRRHAGLFDLGHMGRVRIRGAGAVDFLQKLQTNDVTQIPAGAIRYAMILDEQGLTQDDILVYREADGDDFFLVINAGNHERDMALMHERAAGFDVEIVDQTEQLGMFAIQGPASQEITQQLTDLDLSGLKYYRWAKAQVGGVDLELSRTGYTGEDGFEVYVPQAETENLWHRFLEAGAGHELQPIGLGARDTLRLEAGMPLYGHEIDETTTPFDAGLRFGVKLTHDFVGREALEALEAAGGPQRKLVGLTTGSRRVPRQGYPVMHGDEEVGKILSGTASPTLETNIATCYLPLALSEPGTTVEFAIRDKRERATVTSLPFYKRPR